MSYSAQKPQKWELQESREVYRNDFFNVRQDLVKLPSGRMYDNYFVVERSDWTATLCMSPDRSKILLTRQYKHGGGDIFWELPAGGLDKSEEPEIGALRELGEETGHKPASGKLQSLGAFVVDPATSFNRCNVFFCDDAVEAPELKEDNDQEIIECEWVDVDTVLGMICEAKQIAGNHIAVIMFALLKLNVLTAR